VCTGTCLDQHIFYYEEFEDTKGAIRIRMSNKNRQYNGQKKKYKRTNNELPSPLKVYKHFNNI
jgi:hypothetical protein